MRQTLVSNGPTNSPTSGPPRVVVAVETSLGSRGHGLLPNRSVGTNQTWISGKIESLEATKTSWWNHTKSWVVHLSCTSAIISTSTFPKVTWFPPSGHQIVAFFWLSLELPNVPRPDDGDDVVYFVYILSSLVVGWGYDWYIRSILPNTSEPLQWRCRNVALRFPNNFPNGFFSPNKKMPNKHIPKPTPAWTWPFCTAMLRTTANAWLKMRVQRSFVRKGE